MGRRSGGWSSIPTESMFKWLAESSLASSSAFHLFSPLCSSYNRVLAFSVSSKNCFTPVFLIVSSISSDYSFCPSVPARSSWMKWKPLFTYSDRTYSDLYQESFPSCSWSTRSSSLRCSQARTFGNVIIVLTQLHAVLGLMVDSLLNSVFLV